MVSNEEINIKIKVQDAVGTSTHAPKYIYRLVEDRKIKSNWPLLRPHHPSPTFYDIWPNHLTGRGFFSTESCQLFIWSKLNSIQWKKWEQRKKQLSSTSKSLLFQTGRNHLKEKPAKFRYFVSFSKMVYLGYEKKENNFFLDDHFRNRFLLFLLYPRFKPINWMLEAVCPVTHPNPSIRFILKIKQK